jgi:CBS domain-containing protein
MKIKGIMTRSVEVMPADGSLQDAAARMKSHDIGALPVLEGGRLVGLLTDRDIVVRAVSEGKDPRTTPVREAMTRDVVSCGEDDSVKDVAGIMKGRQIRRVVVLDASKQPVGIVSLGDLAVDTKDDALKGEVLEEVSTPVGRR